MLLEKLKTRQKNQSIRQDYIVFSSSLICYIFVLLLKSSIYSIYTEKQATSESFPLTFFCIIKNLRLVHKKRNSLIKYSKSEKLETDSRQKDIIWLRSIRDRNVTLQYRIRIRLEPMSTVLARSLTSRRILRSYKMVPLANYSCGG